MRAAKSSVSWVSSARMSEPLLSFHQSELIYASYDRNACFVSGPWRQTAAERGAAQPSRRILPLTNFKRCSLAIRLYGVLPEVSGSSSAMTSSPGVMTNRPLSTS